MLIHFLFTAIFVSIIFMAYMELFYPMMMRGFYGDDEFGDKEKRFYARRKYLERLKDLFRSFEKVKEIAKQESKMEKEIDEVIEKKTKNA